jgi:ABC-type multidrug transport system fused ATPase/permease subunit
VDWAARVSSSNHTERAHVFLFFSYIFFLREYPASICAERYKLPDCRWFSLGECAAETIARTIPAQLYDEICKYALYFVGFAVVSSLVTAGMIIAYDIVGEKLTTNLRERTFQYVYLPKHLLVETNAHFLDSGARRATVRQDVGYFDMEENSTGAITARLATDATLVKSIAGQNQGRMVCHSCPSH